MSILLDGKSLAQQVRERVAQEVKQHSVPLTLAVILVGTDPASHTYVHLKQLACQEVGIGFELFAYPAFVNEHELLARIQSLNERPDITGILIQLPLPGQNPDPLIAAMDPRKDADGFHPKNLQHLRDEHPTLIPAVALGILALIEETKTDLSCLQGVIVGSQRFAEPLVSLLKKRGTKIKVIAPEDPSLKKETLEADLLISAVGHPGLITKDMVKPRAIVIDVGTTKVEQKITGDVAPDVEEVAGWMTPVPGGVGPMTVAMLLQNVLTASHLQTNTPE